MDVAEASLGVPATTDRLLGYSAGDDLHSYRTPPKISAVELSVIRSRDISAALVRASVTSQLVFPESQCVAKKRWWTPPMEIPASRMSEVRTRGTSPGHIVLFAGGISYLAV